jgi:preprotein translocase subunit SecD
MKRRLWFSLIATVVAVIAALAGNIATSNEPILGLDLQGGLSVILAPEEGATGDDLLVVRDLVRSSLERSGVAEPDVRVQGSNIVVDLPGVKDKEEALRSVSVSGIVELRSVVNFTECSASLTPAVAPEETIAEGRVLGSDGTITVNEEPASDGTITVDEEGAAFLDDEAKMSFRRSAPDPDAPVQTAAPAETEAPVDPVPADEVPLDLAPTLAPSISGAEFLPTLDGGALCAGPSQASGEVFERDSASVQLGQFGGFSVSVDLRGDGEAAWNALASQCFNRLPSCPSTGVDTDGSARPGQIAIVLDGIVQSAPVVNVPVFDGSVSITGSFTQDEADQLSDVLNRGAFPVQVTPQETRTVSASAGGDSLRAAIIAGLIGLALVLTFLVAYYRWLAFVIIGGLTVWAMAVYSAAAFVSGATNYALSLAGVTGIIVAIGVTVDSYVVFFERMKDEIRNGRTLRNAAPRSFNSTWRTIWSADLVSIIGALILFSLSVGSVRGFALYLGITTLCDLFVCYFFTRPAVLLIARSKFMVGKRAFGLEVASS